MTHRLYLINITCQLVLIFMHMIFIVCTQTGIHRRPEGQMDGQTDLRYVGLVLDNLSLHSKK